MLVLLAMDKSLYSLRMRASRSGGHLSGAERLAPTCDLERLAAAMVNRALNHSRGRAENIHLTIESLDAATVRYAQLPDLLTFSVDDWRQGRTAAGKLLVEAGVSLMAAERAMAWMAEGCAPDGRSMRGAMLIDALTGQRLEEDPFRGVRVGRMDLTAEAEESLRAGLRRLELDNLHVREALVLAGKVALAPEVMAELCWSDDPDYNAGYVAAASLGYVRFPHLKPMGEERGGRAFFIAPGADIPSLLTFLEKAPVLFEQVGVLRDPVPWKG
ncbi:MAG: 6-carboxyhexanoate--CoA ligase [Syntrophotaleaceae bacterium]